jgi:hypothetical protein
MVFGQMRFGKTKFGQMTFRSKFVGEMIFSAPEPFSSKTLVPDAVQIVLMRRRFKSCGHLAPSATEEIFRSQLSWKTNGF